MSDDPFDIPDVPDPSDRSRGSGGEGAGSPRRWPWLLAGVALGVAATLLVPRYVTPHLPAPFRAGELRVQGPVLAEQQGEDRLLLTVGTEQGAMLVTFRQQVTEIALLVDEGDTVTLGVREYRPFVQDPTLVGVWKARPPAGDAAADTASPARARPDTLSQAGPSQATPGSTAPAEDAVAEPPDEATVADTTDT